MQGIYYQLFREMFLIRTHPHIASYHGIIFEIFLQKQFDNYLRKPLVISPPFKMKDPKAQFNWCLLILEKSIKRVFIPLLISKKQSTDCYFIRRE